MRYDEEIFEIQNRLEDIERNETRTDATEREVEALEKALTRFLLMQEVLNLEEEEEVQ